MKKGGLLIGFVPLIVYGVCAGNTVTSVTIALAAAATVTVLVSWKDLRNKMILAWTNLVLFGGALIAVGVLHADWIVPYMSLVIYGTLALVSLGTVLVGKPFTLQYARTIVDKGLWNSPVFIRVNFLLSGMWGAIFLVNLGLSTIIIDKQGLTGLILQGITYCILIVGILITLWYPGHIRSRYAPAGKVETAG